MKKLVTTMIIGLALILAFSSCEKSCDTLAIDIKAMELLSKFEFSLPVNSNRNRRLLVFRKLDDWVVEECNEYINIKGRDIDGYLDPLTDYEE